jgi:type I restriction enzyme S subunit
MSFPRYPRYKDSGVEWLGEVPEHWRVDRLKRSTHSTKNGVWGNEPQGDDNDVVCIRVADFDRWKLRVNLGERTIRNVIASDRAGRMLNTGDLLLEKSGGGDNQPVGCVVLYDHAGPAVCSNFVARVVIAAEMIASFWRYYHAAMYSLRLNTRSIKQTSGIQNLDQQQYFDEPAAFPPSSEQLLLAEFLDRETAKIDKLIGEQGHLITLLKEKSRAVISHAVTRGLDPDAPMKPSGVEWLGDMPADWDVLPIKRVLTSVEQGWSPQCESYPAEGPDEWGVLKVGCVNGGKFKPSENKLLPAELDPIPELGIKSGDVLVSRANTRELVGSAVVVGDDYPKLLLCDKLYRLRVNEERCLPAFLALYLTSAAARTQVEIGATGASSSMLNIGQSTILEMYIPLPPVEIQRRIVDRISDQLISSANLQQAAERAIALLQERRTALISAAVTGKIDVRGLVEAA